MLTRLGLAILVIGLVTLGLLSVGGPGAGRMERRDRARLDDLHALSAQVTCAAEATTGALPEVFQTDPPCAGDIRLNDPFTGAPYRYERLSASTFRLCADFEAPERLRIFLSETLDPANGCLQVKFHKP